MNTRRSFMLLVAGAVLASCGLFDKNTLPDLTAPVPTARVKFHNYSPSSVGVNFFGNNTKLTGVLSAQCSPPPAGDTLCLKTGIEATTGTTYGNAAAGGLYVAVTPAQYTLISKIAAKDTVVSTLIQDVANTKYYSYFMSGIYNTATKTAEAFIVEDPIPATQDFTVALVRLVNAVSNGSSDITLYAKNTTTSVETAVGPAVVYKTAGAFVSLTPGVYDLTGRYGATTNVTGLTLSAQSFRGGFVYTITARGNTGSASTMALTNIPNQK